MTADYRGDSYTAALTVVNPDIINGAGKKFYSFFNLTNMKLYVMLDLWQSEDIRSLTKNCNFFFIQEDWIVEKKLRSLISDFFSEY